MITHSSPQPTARLLASLLPATWPDRFAILAAATRLDAQHGGDASSLLLDAWRTWRCCGRVPRAGPLRDLVAVLVELLGGVGHELRRRPRCETNDTPHATGASAGVIGSVVQLGGKDG